MQFNLSHLSYCARPELVEGFSSSAQRYPFAPVFQTGVPIGRNWRWG